MDDALALIEKHLGNGLLLDSNLCVLYLVGKTNEHRIPRFGRTQAYTIQEFHLLNSIVMRFRTVVTTPHVLTEVSNLARLKPPELGRLRGLLRGLADRSTEIYQESSLVAADPSFPDLGLTDAAILMAARAKCLVLTADSELYLAMQTRGIDAINFNHIRFFA